MQYKSAEMKEVIDCVWHIFFVQRPLLRFMSS